ncbi:MAG: sigma-70 family RNA polymerase sigma factor [Deltaproteobacteria bacterium]|nr:sigma-70 family RNA polymerase sigma factor [Deltaproteobacteria bacterium]
MGNEIVERRPLPRPRASDGGGVDPDRELVLRWRAGDEGAFADLVRRHERRVFRLLLRMLGSREEAEDAAQETFLNLHRHGHRFRGDALFSTFVYRVAANAALNRRRTLGRRHAREEGFARAQHEGTALTSAPPDPEHAAAQAERRSAVQVALLGLPPRLRLPLVLYDVEGLAYPDIARALDVPEGTVKSRIHRARERLRELLLDAGAIGAEDLRP